MWKCVDLLYFFSSYIIYVGCISILEGGYICISVYALVRSMIWEGALGFSWRQGQWPIKSYVSPYIFVTFCLVFGYNNSLMNPKIWSVSFTACRRTNSRRVNTILWFRLNSTGFFFCLPFPAPTQTISTYRTKVPLYCTYIKQVTHLMSM
jgi:hypothetical protein